MTKSSYATIAGIFKLMTKSSYATIIDILKGVCALRGYFGPPMRPKNEISFSPNSSYWFIRTMTQVYKYEISLTLTVAMVTKMATKTG